MDHVNNRHVACSVVVPAYNAARTIRETLASALAQSISEIEVIVVDDGSRDDTAEIVAAIAADDRRVRLITRVNAGVSAARNAGIAAARAAVVACLDADDLWPAHHLATHLHLLAENPLVDLSFSTARYIDEAGRVVGASHPQLSGLEARDLLIANPTTTTSTWVVRRSAFELVGPFDVALTRSEDQAWLIRAALAGLGIAGTNGSIVDYRISTSGLASDLAGMHAGFGAMLGHIAAIDPEFIGVHRTAALAAEDLYLARRALQLDLPPAVALAYLQSAAAGSPRHLVRHPRAFAGVLLRLGHSILSQSRRKPDLRTRPLQS